MPNSGRWRRSRQAIGNLLIVEGAAPKHGNDTDVSFCAAGATVGIFWKSSTQLRAFARWISKSSTGGGSIMTVSSLLTTQRAVAIKEGFIPAEIRAFIAEYVGMGVEQITDTTHFMDDLDIDRLDRLQLKITIQDTPWGGLDLDAIAGIKMVGVLIDRVASLDHERTAAMLVSRKVMHRRM